MLANGSSDGSFDRREETKMLSNVTNVLKPIKRGLRIQWGTVCPQSPYMPLFVLCVGWRRGFLRGLFLLSSDVPWKDMHIRTIKVHCNAFCSNRRTLVWVGRRLVEQYTSNHIHFAASHSYKLLPIEREPKFQVACSGHVQLAVGCSLPVSAQGNPIFNDSSDLKVLLLSPSTRHWGCLFVFLKLVTSISAHVKCCLAVWEALRWE